jgi:hypothetical protein
LGFQTGIKKRSVHVRLEPQSPAGVKAMPDFEMTIQVAQDRKVTALEIAPLGQSPQRLVLALDELDKLIGELGNARSTMVEGQSPPNFESDDVSISVAANTKWHIRAFPPAGALFAFYHPKFGPVGFTLPIDQIARIVSFLTERFILQPTKSGEKH